MLEGSATMLDSQTVFECADLVLDSGQRAVFRAGVHLQLPRLTFDLLRALMDAAPRVLGHDELATKVWHGRLVSPETVAQRLLLLRKALGDEAAHPRYVRVVRGVGCQLVPAVRTRMTAPDARAAPVRVGGRRRSDAAEPTSGPLLSLPSLPSIVVLPFEGGDEPANRDLARGLTHDIITRVGRTRSFFVIARGTSFRLATGAKDVRDIARTLGVRYVLQGLVQFGGSGVRVHAALADAIDSHELWAEHLDRALGDVFQLQKEISELIVGAISSEVEFAERQRSLLQAPASLDASSAYHRGCWHMYRFTAADQQQAREFFELSLSLDPQSSRACAGLSYVHWQQVFLGIALDRSAEIGRALDMACRSVALDPRDPLGHWALGHAHLLRGEFDVALAELEAATDLNPSFAVGQYSLGFALMQAGELSRGIEYADRARRLSPYDPLRFAMIGVRAFSRALAGEGEEASRLMALAVEDPNAHYHMLAMAAVCDVLAGRDEAARLHLRRLRAVRPGYAVADFLQAFRFQRDAHATIVRSAFRHIARLR